MFDVMAIWTNNRRLHGWARYTSHSELLNFRLTAKSRAAWIPPHGYLDITLRIVWHVLVLDGVKWSAEGVNS
jgi:hypothetical protein